jgi:hypothetical protein
MKVFISWSDERSRQVAEALRYWLPKVIQAIQPWMSSSDIEKGTRWRTDVASELEQSSIGIICLTPENLNSTWIHFEAGALSKQQQNTYVCTFLYDLEPAGVREPLAQFQTTKAHREDVKKLVQTINNVLGENKLPESEINESFDVWWPKFEERLNNIATAPSSPEPQREDREILEEILELIREQSRIGKPQAQETSKQQLRTISGKALLPRDVRTLAEFYGISPNEVRKSFFEEDAVNEMIEILTKNKITRGGLVLGNKDSSRSATFPGKESDENSNP